MGSVTESRAMVYGTCFNKGCVDGDEEISRKEEFVIHELRLNLKFMVVTAELVQTELLEVEDGELGMCIWREGKFI